jgi:hypothetical protein
MKTKNSLVLANRNLSVDFFDKVNDDGDDDQESRATDGNSCDAGDIFDNNREDSNATEEESADES